MQRNWELSTSIQFIPENINNFFNKFFFSLFFNMGVVVGVKYEKQMKIEIMRKDKKPKPQSNSTAMEIFPL